MSRRRSREYAVQMLFQWDVAEAPEKEVLDNFWGDRQIKQDVRKMAEKLFTTAVERLDDIDERLQAAARNWKLERMTAVDRNILRMAVAELLVGKTPPAVVLDEAVEIARRFGTEKSPEFVNGVLDAVRVEMERSPV